MSIAQTIMRRTSAFLAVVLISCSMTFAQTLTVKGTVKDNNGEPLAGVNIVEKGTTNGTLTDIDGNYSLNIATGKTIVFSYIGYTPKEVKATSAAVDVTLSEDNQVLEETIVVGYGSVKKSNLTSSVSKISSGAMEDRPLTQVGDAFQGQLAGVQAQAANGGIPGEELTIHIRGVNTITGDSNPLYVIDGVPRDNMSDINPSDIESVQILKDASATSIYGSRGANGVVLIQTKTGKGKPTVNFSSYVGWQVAEKNLDTMSGEEWVALHILDRNYNYLRSGGKMTDPMSARLESQQIPSWWLTTTNFTNWQKEVLQTALLQNYEASASASGDMGSIFLSVGYQNQEGIILNTDYSRINMRLNATLNIMKNLRVGMNIAYSNSTQNAGGTVQGSDRNGKESPMHHALMMSPLVPVGLAVYNEDGTGGAPGEQQYGSSWIDPKLRLLNSEDVNKKNRAQASIYGEWDIIKGLTFKTQYSRTFDGTQYNYFCPNWLNERRGPSSARGYSSQTNVQDWTIQNTLTWDKTFGKHTVNVLLGQSAEKQDYYYTFAEATNWAYNTQPTLNLGSTPVTASTEGNAYTNASFFGRVSYDYGEKYLLTFSLRRDGSSRFGKNTKWGTFPSGSIGWKLSSEEWLKDQEWLNLLKIRASLGVSGNDRIGDYEYVAQLGTYNTAFGGGVSNGAAASNIANPDLKWETTRSLDLGLDFSAWHNRLQLNFDWYKNNTTDLLYYVQTPQTTGFTSKLTNLGEIENTGWELDITSHNIVKKNFKWDTALNLSRNRVKVVDLGGDEYFQPEKRNGQIFRSYVGGPLSQFYVYRTAGVLTKEDIANGYPQLNGNQEEGGVKYIDLNKDGSITADDMQAYGNPLPDLTWGITNTFTYKNWSLSFLIQGQVGGNVLYLGARHNDSTWNGCGRTLLARWGHMYVTDDMRAAMNEETYQNYIKAHGLNNNWDGKTPNLWTNNACVGEDDRRIFDATYVRIKNINLSYTFDKKLLAKAHISGLKIYGSIDNVKTFSDYPGFTPESSSDGNGAQIMGVDYATYPLARKFTIGINLTF